MHSAHVHGVVEITEKARGAIEAGGKAVKAISGAEAFRRYDRLRGVPVRNVSGNFRGMVINARWRAVFEVITSRAAHVAESVGVLAGFALNLANSAPEIERIWNSNDPWGDKASKLSTQASSAAIRTALGIVPASTHALAMSLQGYCQIGDLLTGQAISQPGSWESQIKSLDAVISARFNHFTDGNYIYSIINTQINPRVSRLLGV